MESMQDHALNSKQPEVFQHGAFGCRVDLIR